MPFPRRQDITPATLSLTTLLSKTFQRFLPTPWALSWVTRRSLCHKLKLALLQGSQLKFYILQMEQKASKFEKSSNKNAFPTKKNCKTSANLPTSVRPADLGGFFISANPQRWRVFVVCRWVETRLSHWHATSARFIEVAQGSIFSDSAWIPMDIRQKHIKTTKNTGFFFLHFIVVSKVCPRRNWKNTGYVSYIPWKDWVQSKMM